MVITPKSITQYQKGLRENPIFASEILNYFAKWDDDVDFDKGTYTGIERYDSGTSTILQLKKNPNTNADITYSAVADYTLSDSTKITVDGGYAKLWVYTGTTAYAYWRLDESTGSIINDSSGNNRTGTAANTSWTTGVLGSALSFNGSTSSVNFGQIAAFNKDSAFSVECWINTTLATTTSGTILGKRNDTPPNAGWALEKNYGAGITFYLVNLSTNAMIISTNIAVPLSTWVFVVATYNGQMTSTGVNLYINSSITSKVVNLSALTGSITTVANFHIGSMDGGLGFYKGLVDSAAIYNYVLSQADINYRYNAGSGRFLGIGQYYTDDDLYVETKDATRISTTSLISWEILSLTAANPASTDIRVQLSNDKRTSWLKFSTTSWVTASSATRAQATIYTTAQTNFSKLATGSNTCDIRVFLYTSDANTTPSVNNVDVEYCTSRTITGEYISNEYNSGNLSQEWNLINYSVNTPTGTAIIIRARAGNYSGTLGSYSSAFTNLEDTNLTGQYFQWKVELTGSSLITPTLDWTGINYRTNETTEKNP